MLSVVVLKVVVPSFEVFCKDFFYIFDGNQVFYTKLVSWSTQTVAGFELGTSGLGGDNLTSLQALSRCFNHFKT
jgi:hypothetical protein